MQTVTEPSRPDEQCDSETSQRTPLRIRYRIRFAKQGLLRWISHRDLARLWERLLRRGQFQLSMTEGFHPKPRIGFPSALALGVEGLDEVVEIELAENLEPREVLARMRADDQPGLKVHRVSRLPDGFGKAQLAHSDYTISVIEAVDVAAVEASIKRLLSEDTVTIQRKNKPVRFQVASHIRNLDLYQGLLRLSLAASDAASLRPADVLDLLQCGDWIDQGAQITRVAVVLQKDIEDEEPSMTAHAEPSETVGQVDPHLPTNIPERTSLNEHP